MLFYFECYKHVCCWNCSTIVCYLDNKPQYVEFNNLKSSSQEIKCGVSHGSMLGLLLCLLYTNDFSIIYITFNFILLPDDTTMINTDKDTKL